MAIINHSPWADAANVGQGLGASLTNLMIELPRLRQQQQESMLRQQVLGAQIPTYAAQTAADNARAAAYMADKEYRNAQTAELRGAEVAKEGFGNAMRQIPTTLALGGSINHLISDAVEHLARIPGDDRRSLGEVVAQMVEFSNPKFRQNLALGNKGEPFNVPAGATAIDPSTGAPVFQSPRTLSYGQQLVPGAGGQAIATARDRPVHPTMERLGSVYGAFARAAAEDARWSGEDPQEAMARFVDTISSLNPNFENRAITEEPKGTNAAPRTKVRRNPQTGKLEIIR